MNLFYHTVPQKIYLRIGKCSLLYSLHCTKFISSVDDRHLSRKSRQVNCFFHRSISASGHIHFKISEKISIAGCTI